LFPDDEMPAVNEPRRPSFTLPRVYPITDVLMSGLSHGEQVERLIAGGGRLIQLRDKNVSPRDFYQSARRAAEIAAAHNVPIIINDRVDIALALGLGVHLGQDDLPPEQAREILGPNAIIGFSTHTLEQAKLATALPVHYIAFGPIFETASKPDTEPTVGLELLRTVRMLIGATPLVAIGGITLQNAASVLAAGADCIAVIGAVVGEGASVERLMQELTAAAN
jgi:thiamine-phosphate pyrophosphorylase